MRKILLVTAVLITGLWAMAETDYERVSAKSRRFFDNAEWASATAMYILMLEERPDVAETYSRAAVAYIMTGDTARAVDLVPVAMSHQVPLDTMLHGVRAVSFSIGRGELYEHYLSDIKTTYPWLSRVADNYLMRYYAFRNNGPELIRYAETMLDGMPDSREFLRMLAYGRLLTGDSDGAMKVWTRVLVAHPDDYDTLLDMANCCAATGNLDEALRRYESADSIRPTPYVTARIEQLRAHSSIK